MEGYSMRSRYLLSVRDLDNDWQKFALLQLAPYILVNSRLVWEYLLSLCLSEYSLKVFYKPAHQDHWLILCVDFCYASGLKNID